MIEHASEIGSVSYALGALTFLLAIVVLPRRLRGLHATLFVMAAALTIVWTGLAAFAYASGTVPGELSVAVEQARTLAWLAVVWNLWRVTIPPTARMPLWLALAIPAGLVAAVALAPAIAPVLVADAGVAVHEGLALVLVFTGFVFIENLYRNTPARRRWPMKLLCIGLAALFAFDLLFYLDAILLHRLGAVLAPARGAVQAIVAPLLAASFWLQRRGPADIGVSQKTALYLTAAIAGALYVVLMVLAATYIHSAGGSWMRVAQFVFLFAAILLLAVIAVSGTVRAYLRVFVLKSFFRYRYDYREAWMRFTRTVSEGENDWPLEVRVIRAIAATVHSPAGALWLRRQRHYVVEATWGLTASSLSETESAPLMAYLDEMRWVVDIRGARARPEAYGDLALPDALARIADAWILVPLVLRGEVVGFVVLSRPRVCQALGWEDHDLLKMQGRQAASYLAEQTAARELSEAQEFDRFNRRAAYAVHDIKTIVSQLSLLSSNLERHGDDPAFRKDMTVAVADAASRMRRVLQQITAERDTEPPASAIRLRPLLDNAVTVRDGDAVALRCDDHSDDVEVAADSDRLRTILDQVIENAVEAGGETNPVRIAFSRRDGSAVVEVTDDGPGMEPAFVRDHLFRPFRSTKRHGLGIGSHQCREYARDLGGDVEVISRPGVGTTTRITVPVADGDPERRSRSQ